MIVCISVLALPPVGVKVARTLTLTRPSRRSAAVAAPRSRSFNRVGPQAGRDGAGRGCLATASSSCRAARARAGAVRSCPARGLRPGPRRRRSRFALPRGEDEGVDRGARRRDPLDFFTVAGEPHPAVGTGDQRALVFDPVFEQGDFAARGDTPDRRRLRHRRRHPTGDGGEPEVAARARRRSGSLPRSPAGSPCSR